MLEMMTGLRAVDPKRANGQQNLVEWVKPSLSNKKKLLKGIMDPKLEGQYSLKAALQTAQLALKCLQPEPKNRPSMKDVVVALGDIQSIQSRSKQSNNKRCSSNNQSTMS